MPLSAICEIVDEVFRNNYMRSVDTEESEGEPLSVVLYYLTDAESEDIAEAIAEYLIDDDDPDLRDGEETFYSDDFSYEKVQLIDQSHGALWRDFRQSIVHGRRFFNDESRKLLSEIFRNIHLQRDVQRNPPVYMLEPTDAGYIHRARIVSEDDIRKISEDPVGGLGPAPMQKGKAGRMNVSGIPAFYGSFDLQTSVAELRPPVGSKIASARFQLARPLCVLDMTRFRKRPKQLDLFAKDHVRRLTQWRFMQRFRREMSKPILKTDEHIDYVPTQAVAEYLNAVHEVRMGDKKVHIDAIIFNSAQRPEGRNIVVLGDAAFVEPSKGNKKRSAAGPVAPSLDLFMQGKPAAPGFKIIAGSVNIAYVTKAEIGLGDPELIDDYLNPPF